MSWTVMVCMAVCCCRSRPSHERANKRVVACSVTRNVSLDTSMLTAPQLSDAEASSRINSSEHSAV